METLQSRSVNASGKRETGVSGGKSEPWGNRPLSDTMSDDPMRKATEQMMRCVLELEQISQDVADAKTIREFSSDRVKRAFSVTVAEFLEAGDSGVAAEHKSRASKAYGTALHDLAEQYRTALRVIERHDAIKATFEAARSLLSVEKAKMALV